LGNWAGILAVTGYGNMLQPILHSITEKGRPASVDAAHPASPPMSKPPELLDQVKRCIHDRHYSLRTEETYIYWIDGISGSIN
jgi:hypothetical protein